MDFKFVLDWRLVISGVLLICAIKMGPDSLREVSLRFLDTLAAADGRNCAR